MALTYLLQAPGEVKISEPHHAGKLLEGSPTAGGFLDNCQQ